MTSGHIQLTVKVQ